MARHQLRTIGTTHAGARAAHSACGHPIVATQYPNDLSDAVAGATATRLFFSQSMPDPIKAIQATLVGKNTGTEAERVATDIRGMQKLHRLIENQQHRPY